MFRDYCRGNVFLKNFKKLVRYQINENRRVFCTYQRGNNDYIFDTIEKRRKKNIIIDYDREIMNQVNEELNIKDLEEWYHMRPQAIRQANCKPLKQMLKRYESIFDALNIIFYEKKWDISKMHHKFVDWDNINHQKSFVERIKERLDVKNDEDWAKIPTKDLKKEFPAEWVKKLREKAEEEGEKTMEGYEKILLQLIPGIQWKKASLKIKENQRRVFDDIARKLNIKTQRDWRDVTDETIRKLGGKMILTYYQSSVFATLQNIYPEYEWDVFEHRSHLPLHFLKSKENQRKLMENIGKKLGIKQVEDWINVKETVFRRNGGEALIKYYRNFFTLLQSVYPEKKWNIFERDYVPYKFWKEKANRRKFMDEISSKLGITKLDDWYDINERTFAAFGGGGLLTYYKNLFELLKDVYPEHSWDVNSKKQLPRQYWDAEENQIQFLQEMKIRYKIEKPTDWYRISKSQILSLRASGLLRGKEGICWLLKKHYPNFPWDESKFLIANKKSVQRVLFQFIKQLFGNYEIVEEFTHEQLTRIKGKAIEFDVFIPQLSVAFEYHGEHHYYDIPKFGPVEMYQTRDLEKLEIAKQNSIHFIVVPYWWDGSREFIVDLIRSQNELLLQYVHPLEADHFATETSQ